MKLSEQVPGKMETIKCPRCGQTLIRPKGASTVDACGQVILSDGSTPKA